MVRTLSSFRPAITTKSELPTKGSFVPTMTVQLIVDMSAWSAVSTPEVEAERHSVRPPCGRPRLAAHDVGVNPP